MAYVLLSTRRSLRAAKSDVPLPDYTKEPRPIHIVWEANSDFTEHEINRLLSLFKNKDLESLTGEQSARECSLLAQLEPRLVLQHQRLVQWLQIRQPCLQMLCAVLIAYLSG